MTGLLRLEEEIVTRVPGCLIEYTLISGLPLDDYVGRIELSPVADGTELSWSATFQTKKPATRWFWKRLIELIIRKISRDAVQAVRARAGQIGQHTLPSAR